MSWAKLTSEPQKVIRVNLLVELDFEDKEKALKIANRLEKLSAEIDSEEGECYAWAQELADLIRNN